MTKVTGNLIEHRIKRAEQRRVQFVPGRAFAEAQGNLFLSEVEGDDRDNEDDGEGEAAGFVMEKLGAGRWRVNGLMRLDDFRREHPALGEVSDVDTLGGLAFLLAGRILSPGESVAHSSGWRLESVEADERMMIRLRLHAPEGAEVAEG